MPNTKSAIRRVKRTWKQTSINRIRKGKYRSVTSIGNRPTFDDNLHSVETFILGLQSDIYGSILKLEFVSWLRAQVKYENIQDLKDQIAKDVQIAKEILENT